MTFQQTTSRRENPLLTFEEASRQLDRDFNLNAELEKALKAAKRYGILGPNGLNMSEDDYCALFASQRFQRSNLEKFQRCVANGETLEILFVPPLTITQSWDLLFRNAIPTNSKDEDGKVPYEVGHLGEIREINPANVPDLEELLDTHFGSRHEDKRKAFKKAYDAAPELPEPRAKIVITTQTSDTSKSTDPSSPEPVFKYKSMGMGSIGGSFSAIQSAEQTLREGIKYLDPVSFCMLIRKQFDEHEHVSSLLDLEPETYRSAFKDLFSSYETAPRIWNSERVAACPLHVFPDGRIFKLKNQSQKVYASSSGPSNKAPMLIRRLAIESALKL